MTSHTHLVSLVLFAVLVMAFIPVGGAGFTGQDQAEDEDIPPEKGVILDDKDWHKINDTMIFDASRENPRDPGIPEEDRTEGWNDNDRWQKNVEPYEQLRLVSGLNRSNVTQIAEGYDFIYNTTFPTMEYPESNTTAAESRYRGNQYDLDEIYYYEFQNFTKHYLGNLSVSNRTKDSPPPQSGDYIKDAHSTIVGVPGSAQIKSNLSVNGARILPERGRVFTFMDYRIQINDSVQCEQVSDTRRICREEKFENTSIKEHIFTFATDVEASRVRLGNRRSAVVPYCCNPGYGKVSFTTEVVPKVVVNVTTTEYRLEENANDTDRWAEVSRTHQEEVETLRVRDHLVGYRLGNTSIRQQVFEGSTENLLKRQPQNQINISVWDGSNSIPKSLEDNFAPYLWHKITFENGGTITNNWQVYSNADNQSAIMYFENKTGGSNAESGGSRSRREIKEIDGPVFPDLYIAPTRLKPTIEGVDGRLFPDESKVETISPNGFPIHPNNTLSFANYSETYGSFYLKKINAEVASATDIAGNEIPVNTSYWDAQPLKYSIHGKDGDRFAVWNEKKVVPTERGAVWVRLWRWYPPFGCEYPECGQPLVHDTVQLSGTVRTSATTNEHGWIRIQPDGQEVTISWEGWDIIGHSYDIGAGRDVEDPYGYIERRDRKKLDTEIRFAVKQEPTSGSAYVDAFFARMRLILGFLIALVPAYWTAKRYRS